MENNHLTYFKVENFKLFESLEVKDIGQFNLIVGDNNSGKTCLLEALLFDEDQQQLLDNFYTGLTKRGLIFKIEKITREVDGISTTETIYPKENYFKKYIFGKYSNGIKINYHLGKNENEIILNVPETKEELIQLKNVVEKEYKKKHDIKETANTMRFKNGTELSLDVLSQQYCFRKNNGLDISPRWIYDYNLDNLNFPLISFNSDFYGNEIIKLFGEIKTSSQEDLLLNTLKVVMPNLVSFQNKPFFGDLKDAFIFRFKDQDELIPLNYLGDGFKRIFYITLKALSLQGKRLLIDEIEIGIHHTKQQEFIKNLLLICKELDIQLFMTTHSEECAEAYAEALKELELEEKGKLIILKKHNGVTKSYTLNTEELETGINNGFSVRG